MSIDRIIFLVPLTVFYISYLFKMIMLNRQGIKGNILGQGSKPKRVKTIERCIQVITYTGVVIQYASVLFFGTFIHAGGLWGVGLVFAWIGASFFIAAVWIMKDNWRAGYSADQGTSLVTGGIYQISRNPAFAGFDMLYIGCALAYPNVLTVLWCIAAACVFHLQILSEEDFLTSTFGQEYNQYMKQVGRYVGKRRWG